MRYMQWVHCNIWVRKYRSRNSGAVFFLVLLKLVFSDIGTNITDVNNLWPADSGIEFPLIPFPGCLQDRWGLSWACRLDKQKECSGRWSDVVAGWLCWKWRRKDVSDASSTKRTQVQKRVSNDLRVPLSSKTPPTSSHPTAIPIKIGQPEGWPKYYS